MSAILVLGSNSFAGSSFIRYCLNKNLKVVGISRNEFRNNLFHGGLINEKEEANYVFFKKNLNKDITETLRYIDQLEPNIIVDFAGQGMVSESWKNPEQWFLTNVLTKSILINFLKDKKYLKKYIKISTPEVYGSNNYPVLENQQHNPSTPYALSHSTVDKLSEMYYREFGFPIIIGRFSNFYGPSQQSYRLIPKFIIKSIQHEKFYLHGTGSALRSYIYKDDFAAGIYQLINHGSVGKTYHFSTDEIFSVNNVLEIISNKLNMKCDLISTEDRIGKDSTYILNTVESRQSLQWKPKTNLELGLDLTINWVFDNISSLKDSNLDYVHRE